MYRRAMKIVKSANGGAYAVGGLALMSTTSSTSREEVRKVHNAGFDVRLGNYRGHNVPLVTERLAGVTEHFAKVNGDAEVTSIGFPGVIMLPYHNFGSQVKFDPLLEPFEDVDVLLRLAQDGLAMRTCTRCSVVLLRGEWEREHTRQSDGGRTSEKSGYDQFLSVAGWGPVLSHEIMSSLRIRSSVTVVGPFAVTSGFATEAISYVLPLEWQVPLFIQEYGPGVQEASLRHLPRHVSKTLLRLRGKVRPEPVAGDRHSIRLSVGAAHVFEKPDGYAYHIGRAMYETDRMPEPWVSICNSMDEIWVPSVFNIETFRRAGVKASKLHVIPQSIC